MFSLAGATTTYAEEQRGPKRRKIDQAGSFQTAERFSNNVDLEGAADSNSGTSTSKNDSGTSSMMLEDVKMGATPDNNKSTSGSPMDISSTPTSKDVGKKPQNLLLLKKREEALKRLSLKDNNINGNMLTLEDSKVKRTSISTLAKQAIKDSNQSGSNSKAQQRDHSKGVTSGSISSNTNNNTKGVSSSSSVSSSINNIKEEEVVDEVEESNRPPPVNRANARDDLGINRSQQAANFRRQRPNKLPSKYEEFIPTTEWQTIKSNHACPPGLEYKIDLQTGVKLARKISK